MAVSVNELYPSLLDSCGRGDVLTAQYLLNQGLNVDYIDRRGDFPLLMASAFGRLELVKFLLDEGASIDLVNPRGESALSKAIERGQTEVASLLQQYGAKNKPAYEQSPLRAEVQRVGEDVSSTTSSEEPPKAHGYSRPELSSAITLLRPIASKWMNIGVVLGVPIDILDAIKYEASQSCNACLREMLRVWLNSKQVDPPPTWDNFIEAIELFEPYIAYKARRDFVSASDCCMCNKIL